VRGSGVEQQSQPKRIDLCQKDAVYMSKKQTHCMRKINEMSILQTPAVMGYPVGIHLGGVVAVRSGPVRVTSGPVLWTATDLPRRPSIGSQRRSIGGRI
jgi:hypothetical protein